MLRGQSTVLDENLSRTAANSSKTAAWSLTLLCRLRIKINTEYYALCHALILVQRPNNETEILVDCGVNLEL